MKRLFMYCASLFLLAGCVDEMKDTNSYAGCETLNVSFEPATRIQLDENQVPVWNKGDLLSVYNYRDVNERWMFMGETGASTGVIARNEVVNGGSAIENIVIAYPYRSDYVLNASEKTISTTFASTQTYLEGSYGLNDNVMVSAGTSNDVVLRNVFGWLKFQMTGTTSISKIVVYDNDFMQLHGPIDINYETLDVDFGEYETGETDGLGGSLVDNITLTLDCGESGVSLDPSKSTPFYIAIVPHIFRNGITVEVTGTDGTVMTKKVSREIEVERNVIKPFEEFVFFGDGETGFTDLSSEGTANSYIVSEAGNYKFKTVQGNSVTSVGAVASAETLWETFGTDMAPNVGDLVSNVEYSDGYISFTASDKKGNVSIAAKDASGNILWSWHIWMTDQPEDQVYNNNAGTMMDRNLGAISATPGDVGALGLLYQWGRKDPFLGTSAISGNNLAKSTLEEWNYLQSEAGGTIAFTVANPTCFIKHNENNYDWYYSTDSSTDDTRWQSSKTIYDPCPNGYRIPDGGFWAMALDKWEAFDGNTFNSTYKGFDFGRNAAFVMAEVSSCWYPTTGYMGGYGGGMYAAGDNGYVWSCSATGNRAYFLQFNYQGPVNPLFNHDRANALSVRCYKENSSSTHPPVSIVDLSENGTANSYIVSEEGKYKFPVVQGNSDTPVGDVISVETLWESYGTDVAPAAGDLVSNVRYEEGYISFYASAEKGNAVIAAKDAGGNILWSWHIWMTDKPQDQVCNNNTGIMMDRNLGAISVTPGDVGALGLLYQWGRKDPFLGGSSVSYSSSSNQTKAKSTLSWPLSVLSDSSNGTISYATSHPATFITRNDSNSDWYYTGHGSTDNTRWQSEKTIYDPCPAGYRVPDGGETAVQSTNRGFNLGKVETTNEESSCLFPTAGSLHSSYGSLNNVGVYGYYWSCSPGTRVSAYYLMTDKNGGSRWVDGPRSSGYSVRCLRE